MSEKYRIKIIGKIDHPTLIIGQSPGNQRKNTFDGVCWHGNKSADLLNEAIDGYSNIILTNICQYREINETNLLEGMNDIIRLIITFKPKTVLCLGNYAWENAEKIRTNGGEIYQRYAKFDKLDHPSYIVRFNKDRQQWINNLRSFL